MWESSDEAHNQASHLHSSSPTQLSLLYVSPIFDGPLHFSTSVLLPYIEFSLCPYSFMFSSPKEQSLAWFAESLNFKL